MPAPFTSSSDAAASLPANSNLAAGVGSFTATFKTVGGQTLIAAGHQNSSIAGSGGVSVSPAAVTHFVVSRPRRRHRRHGADVYSHRAGRVQQHRRRLRGHGPLYQHRSRGRIARQCHADGRHGKFSATLETSGNRTLTATDVSSSLLTGVSGAVTVSPAAATHFTVAAATSATAGSPVTLTVTAKDAFNNTATGYSGTVQFGSSDAAAVLPANSKLTGGVGSFSVTLKTAGSQTVTANDAANSLLAGSSAAISVSAAAASHFVVTAPRRPRPAAHSPSR